MSAMLAASIRRVERIIVKLKQQKKHSTGVDSAVLKGDIMALSFIIEKLREI